MKASSQMRFVSTLHFTLERLYQRDIYRIYESRVASINPSDIKNEPKCKGMHEDVSQVI
jgi:hypothetical protein